MSLKTRVFDADTSLARVAGDHLYLSECSDGRSCVQQVLDGSKRLCSDGASLIGLSLTPKSSAHRYGTVAGLASFTRPLSHASAGALVVGCSSSSSYLCLGFLLPTIASTSTSTSCALPLSLARAHGRHERCALGTALQAASKRQRQEREGGGERERLHGSTVGEAVEGSTRPSS